MVMNILMAPTSATFDKNLNFKFSENFHVLSLLIFMSPTI